MFSIFYNKYNNITYSRTFYNTLYIISYSIILA